MPPGEFSCLGGSEYVWQRGVEGISGQVTGGRSLPDFPKKEKLNDVFVLNKVKNGPKRPYNEPKRAKNIWKGQTLEFLGLKYLLFNEKFLSGIGGIKILSWQISVIF